MTLLYCEIGSYEFDRNFQVYFIRTSRRRYFLFQHAKWPILSRTEQLMSLM